MRDRWVHLLVWGVAALCQTAVPRLIWRDSLGHTDDLGPTAIAGTACALLLLTTYAAKPAAPMRTFALALVLQTAGFAVASAITFAPFYVDWAASAPAALSFAIANDLKVIPSALVLAALLQRGWSAERLFLRMGSLNVPVGSSSRGALRWPVAAAIAIFVSLLTIAVFVTRTRPVDLNALSVLMVFGPIVLVGSLINTVCEEFLFRNSVLPVVTPVLRERGALWLSSVRYGLSHYYGNPSGPLGVLAATLIGVVEARSMLDTRGSGWAWLIHWSDDIAIFSLIALTGPTVWHA